MSYNFRFLLILICFLISFIGDEGFDKKDTYFLRSAMFFTVISDFFMIIKDNNILGILFFCIVQQIYRQRYSGIKTFLPSVFFIIVVIFISFFTSFPFIIKLGAVYAVNLLFSVGSAIFSFKNNKFPYPNNYLILFGMILFLLCDLNVALYNLFPNKKLYSYFIWIFYIPSQILLSNSWRKYKTVQQFN